MVKLLKSPNRPNIVADVLILAGLGAIGEVLVPRGGRSVLSATPIVVISKAANNGFLQVQ
jgi:hypothetical protein